MVINTNPSICINHGRFYDRAGRQVLLHGINLVNKNPQAGYLGDETQETFAAFRRWGFNCMRLGVIWDGLEPQPGEYNETYLKDIDQRIAWARQNDLYVFIDMHQDLYSVLFSDGAPAWATLTDGDPHQLEGGVWDDAYYTSPALQTAFEHFWQNSPAPDGVGLQDHYAAAWATLARRYCHEPAVIGYDLMNEPMPGRASPDVLQAMLVKGAEMLAQLDHLDETSLPGLAELFLQPDGRIQLFQRLDDVELFGQILEAPLSLCQSFEQEYLLPFYQRVAKAIRAVDAEKILFLETSAFSNFGIYSSIKPIVSCKEDYQQAYSPHCYDLVTDTEYVAYPNPERVKLIYTRHAETARKWNWPALVGEWGAFDFRPGTLPAARMNVREIEKRLFSETYWCYQPGLEQAECFLALHRPYPERVAGFLEQYQYDPVTGVFTCSWREDPSVKAASVIYLPNWFDFDPHKLELSPLGEAPPEIINQPNGLWLHIQPSGEAGQRTFKAQSK